MLKKYILSFAIIGSFLFFTLWFVLFSAFSFGYSWDWSNVPSFFIKATQDKVEVNDPGRITDIVHKNGNSIITIISENIETKYRVKNNSIQVSIDSSLLAYIAISELTKSTRIAISETYNMFETELVCILLYIIIVNLFFYSCSYIFSLLGRRRITVL
jgi:hypothetical protein